MTAAWNSAAAVPDVQSRATGRSRALARPSAKKAADRSSTCIQTRTPGWRANAIASGAEREPGAMHTASRPQRASSSTKVAAKDWVTFGSAMETVTCLHGFSQGGDSWDEIVSLVPGGHRWLAPELKATTMATAGEELAVLWEREGVERTHLVGYSQGGRLALFIASRHPDRLLTLTTIGAHAGFEGPDRGR